MRIDHLVVFLGGLAASLVGTWACLQEANQFLYAGLDSKSEIAKLVDGSLVTGLSSVAHNAYAETCMDNAASLNARFLAPDQAKRLKEACLDQIGALAEVSPVNSFLWFSHAQLGGDAADWAALNQSYIRAQASGPSEYWLAAKRFRLAQRLVGHLEPEAISHFERDIAMLAQAPQGSRLLATEYLLAKDFRPRVTAVIDKLSEPVQGEFLENVRLLAAQQGGTL